MVAVPREMPFTNPLNDPTVAIDGAEDDQLPPGNGTESKVPLPTHA